MDSAVQIFAHIMSWMFIVGLAGCVVAIPAVALKLFSVLFEADRPGEE